MTARRVRIVGGFGDAAVAAFAACFLAAVAASVRWAALPSIALWIYVAASVVTFVVYAIDKSAARGGRRRTPEFTLHVLGWLGGWPGALIAQRVVRHKTQKVGFQFVTWLAVAVHVGLLGWWVSAHGRVAN